MIRVQQYGEKIKLTHQRSTRQKRRQKPTELVPCAPHMYHEAARSEFHVPAAHALPPIAISHETPQRGARNSTHWKRTLNTTDCITTNPSWWPVIQRERTNTQLGLGLWFYGVFGSGKSVFPQRQSRYAQLLYYCTTVLNLLCIRCTVESDNQDYRKHMILYMCVCACV